jgi:hypothetical protein
MSSLEINRQAPHATTTKRMLHEMRCTRKVL